MQEKKTKGLRNGLPIIKQTSGRRSGLKEKEIEDREKELSTGFKSTGNELEYKKEVEYRKEK